MASVCDVSVTTPAGTVCHVQSSTFRAPGWYVQAPACDLVGPLTRAQIRTLRLIEFYGRSGQFRKPTPMPVELGKWSGGCFAQTELGVLAGRVLFEEGGDRG